MKIIILIIILINLYFIFKKKTILFFMYVYNKYLHINNGDIMNKSIWIEKEDCFDEIKNNINTDILIIGGGISGTNVLYFLKDTSKKIVLVNNTNNNTTCYSTAKITYLQQDTYTKIKNIYNDEIAFKYYQSQKDAIKLITEIINKENIDCDLEKVNSTIFTNNKEEKLKKEKKFLKNHNIKFEEKNDLTISIPCYRNIEVNDTYMFNPYKYITKLKEKLNKNTNISIYDHSIVTSIKKDKDKYKVICNNKLITCNTIIMACHYPFKIEATFPFRTYLEKSIVSAFDYKLNKNISMINIDKDVISCRSYKDKLIFLTNSHNINSKEDIEKEVKKHLKKQKEMFDIPPEYTWINHDIMTNDSLPIAGRIKDTNIYILTGYNTC